MRMKSLSVRRLTSLLTASALVATLAVVTLPVTPVLAAGSGGPVIFDNTPTALPANLPSYGPEAYAYNEWGGGVTFAGTARELNTATVTLSTFACESGSWNGTGGPCVTGPNATFNVPITFNVYNVNGDQTVGSLLTSKTETFAVPYRPSADATNCSATPTKWSDGTTCFNGMATKVTFSFPAGTTLENTAIFGVTFNTNTAGYAPLGVTGPADSLNIATYPGNGVATQASVGTWLPNDTSSYLSNNLTHTAFIGSSPVTQMPTGASDNFVSYEPAVQITAVPAYTATGFFRDGINLTAAQIGGSVTGTLDATGCNIGAYFDATHTGSVSNATIFGANYFGVVANGGTLSTSSTTVHNIGNAPFDGSQHGIGIYYTGASGTISGNTVSLYQKGGIVTRDGGAVTISNNMVTGQGTVTYIAQNGIQVSFGTSARLFGNNVSLNSYSPPKVTACGLLIYQAGGVSGNTKAGIAFIKADNTFHNNETDICNVGKGGGFSI